MPGAGPSWSDLGRFRHPQDRRTPGSTRAPANGAHLPDARPLSDPQNVPVYDAHPARAAPRSMPAARSPASARPRRLQLPAGGDEPLRRTGAAATGMHLGPAHGDGIVGPGAGGHGGDTLHFTNRSGDTGTLTGYPGVAVRGTGGHQVREATRTPGGYLGGMRSEGPIPVVQPAPGQGAAAMVEWIENPQEGQITCPSYTSILVTPPNTYRSTRLELATRIYSRAELEVRCGPGTTGGAPERQILRVPAATVTDRLRAGRRLPAHRAAGQARSRRQRRRRRRSRRRRNAALEGIGRGRRRHTVRRRWC